MTTPQQPFFDVRMKGFRDRAEVADVFALLDARTTRLPGEEVPLLEVSGRVLAEAIVSAVDVPGFARAAMDGFSGSARAWPNPAEASFGSAEAEALPSRIRQARID